MFDATYVVHTHPMLINGLTCAKGGEAACKRLFPDALWVEYIDPGYTLCMEVRERIEQYKAANGNEPALLVLQNHGIFVSAVTPEEIRALYARLLDTLKAEYSRAGISQTLRSARRCGVAGHRRHDQGRLRKRCCVCLSLGQLWLAPGPITPDHLVYSKAFPFSDAADASRRRPLQGRTRLCAKSDRGG